MKTFNITLTEDELNKVEVALTAEKKKYEEWAENAWDDGWKQRHLHEAATLRAVFEKIVHQEMSQRSSFMDKEDA